VRLIGNLIICDKLRDLVVHTTVLADDDDGVVELLLGPNDSFVDAPWNNVQPVGVRLQVCVHGLIKKLSCTSVHLISWFRFEINYISYLLPDRHAVARIWDLTH
jgi:hypothetical protein